MIKGENCCKCEKCLRTINEILAEGENYKEFGFNITINEVIKRTQEYFTGKKILTGGLWWHWQCIQKRVKQILAREKTTKELNETLKSYFIWIATLNLDSYCKTDLSLIKINNDFYKQLWKLGVEGASLGQLSTLRTEIS